MSRVQGSFWSPRDMDLLAGRMRPVTARIAVDVKDVEALGRAALRAAISGDSLGALRLPGVFASASAALHGDEWRDLALERLYWLTQEARSMAGRYYRAGGFETYPKDHSNESLRELVAEILAQNDAADEAALESMA